MSYEETKQTIGFLIESARREGRTLIFLAGRGRRKRTSCRFRVGADRMQRQVERRPDIF